MMVIFHDLANFHTLICHFSLGIFHLSFGINLALLSGICLFGT